MPFIGNKPTSVPLTSSDITDGIITTTKIADANVTNPKLTSGSQQNFRNIIINGDMSIAQRATSTASITSSGYHTLDRFKTLMDSLGTWTQSQSTDVPTGEGFASSLKMDCTTADASPSAGDYLVIRQLFEGQNLQYLKKGTASAVSLTLSFWVKSTKTGTFICEFEDTDNSRNISKSYTVNTTNTWEFKTVTFSGDTTGAFTNDNGGSLVLNFWLGAGSTYTSGTLATTWGSPTSANRVVGQVNIADNTANDFYITGVQLEAGTTASDFEFLPVDANLKRCQRYCHRVQGTSGDEKGIGSGFCVNSTRAIITFIHPVTMRAEPTITEALIQISYRVSSADSSLAGDSDETVNVSSLIFDVDAGSPFTDGDGVNARLDNSTSAFLQLDSEL